MNENKNEINMKKTESGVIIHYPLKRRMTNDRLRAIDSHAQILSKSFGQKIYGVYVEEDIKQPGQWFRISYAFDRQRTPFNGHRDLK